MSRYESVPLSPSPEQPPLAPYDPPDPAPQAEAWRRAEEACCALDIDYDILPLSWARPRFLERALAKVITIP